MLLLAAAAACCCCCLLLLAAAAAAAVAAAIMFLFLFFLFRLPAISFCVCVYHVFPCKGTSTVALGIVSKRSKAFTRFLLLETGRDGICFRMCWRKNEQETGRDGKMREIYRWRDGTNSRCIFFRRDGSVTIMCNDFFFSMTGRDGKYFFA